MESTAFGESPPLGVGNAQVVETPPDTLRDARVVACYMRRLREIAEIDYTGVAPEDAERDCAERKRYALEQAERDQRQIDAHAAHPLLQGYGEDVLAWTARLREGREATDAERAQWKTRQQLEEEDLRDRLAEYERRKTVCFLKLPCGCIDETESDLSQLYWGDLITAACSAHRRDIQRRRDEDFDSRNAEYKIREHIITALERRAKERGDANKRVENAHKCRMRERDVGISELKVLRAGWRSSAPPPPRATTPLSALALPDACQSAVEHVRRAA